MNEKGEIVIAPQFISGGDFSDGLAPVRSGGRYGFIDATGHFQIEPKYDHASGFLQGIACVYDEGRPMIIDKHEKIVLDTLHYRGLKLIGSNNKAIVYTRSKKVGMIDLATQQLVLDTICHSIGDFSNGVAIATKAQPNQDRHFPFYAVVDSTGSFVVNFGKYEKIYPFTDGFARVEIAGSANNGHDDGVIDLKGNLLFQRPYKRKTYVSGDFHDGLAIISLYKHWHPEEKDMYSSEKSYDGFINLKGEIVLNDTTNRSLWSFSHRRTFLRIEDHGYQMVDPNFQPVGKTLFDNVQNEGFKNGYAIVEIDNKWGVIDTTGAFVVEPAYEGIYEGGVVDRLFFYSIQNKDYRTYYGLANLQGKALTPPIIDYFDPSGFVHGLLLASVNNKFTYLDRKGNTIWQQKEEVSPDPRPLNVDHMIRGYFYASSRPHPKDLGGFGRSSNTAKPIIAETFPPNQLCVVVNTDQSVESGDGYYSYKVEVANTLKRVIELGAQDSRLYMKVQALDKHAQWRDIEYLPSSWCGNSYHVLTLAPNHFWSFMTPKYEGEFKTKLRIALTYIDPTKKSKKTAQPKHR